MKVRCVKLLDARGEPQEKSPWLTIGKIYVVLAVELSLTGRWMFRVVSDGANGVALFPLDSFEIVTANLPPNWIISWKSNGFFQIAPETWMEAGFWERFYDRDEQAATLFERERKLIESYA